uniref:CooT family nickel-binding protein n=1 Tax=Geoglobus ahangari TaxID=113653 RepID=A0A7C3YMW2_9EURY
MCESKVVLRENGNEKILMEDVIKIEVEGKKLKMFGLLGEYKEIEGRIVLLDFKNHKIVVEG